MTEQAQAEPAGFPDQDDLQFLPEGPVPIGDSKISWVAIQHDSDAKVGSLCEYDFQEQVNRRYDLPGRPGFAFKQSDGAYVVGLERSLGRFDPADQTFTPWVEDIDGDVENTIINDGLQVGDDFIFGCKDLEFATKKAGLYLYRSADKKLVQLRDDQICSNGKVVVNQDGQMRLYDIDSPTRLVSSYRLDIESGTIDDCKVELDLNDLSAVPDGMTITPDEKHLIIAMFQPDKVSDGQTRMYDRRSGELVKIWHTKGSRQNTCPALVKFGGKHRLVITTAAEHMDEEDRQLCPRAGQFFIGEL